MKIIGAKWTPKANMMLLLCECSDKFYHPANRWTAICPMCGRKGNLAQIRAQYAEVKSLTNKPKKL